jgi:hypothetical protein
MTFTEKRLASRPPIEVAGRRFKRYYVTSEIAPVTADIERAATKLLPKLAPAADRTPPAGFIVLHTCGDGAAYLNAYTWAPIHHERNAWVRHILMPDASDLDGYLADSMLSGHTR